MKKHLSVLLAVLFAALMPAAALCKTLGEGVRDTSEESLVYGFYFENDEDMTDWTNVDADGDGYGWQWYPLAGDEYCYEGRGFMLSYSYDAGALTPDNWLISPGIEVPMGEAYVSIYIGGYGNYPYEHFAVYAGASASFEDMVQLIPETVTGASYARYTADISDFAGSEVYIAVRHFNCTDQNYLRVDNFEIWSRAESAVTSGDVDLNGTVNIADAILALRASMGIIQLEPQQQTAADMDASGSVTIADAILVLRTAMGLK